MIFMLQFIIKFVVVDVFQMLIFDVGLDYLIRDDIMNLSDEVIMLLLCVFKYGQFLMKIKKRVEL